MIVIKKYICFHLGDPPPWWKVWSYLQSSPSTIKVNCISDDNGMGADDGDFFILQYSHPELNWGRKLWNQGTWEHGSLLSEGFQYASQEPQHMLFSGDLVVTLYPKNTGVVQQLRICWQFFLLQICAQRCFKAVVALHASFDTLNRDRKYWIVRMTTMMMMIMMMMMASLI